MTTVYIIVPGILAFVFTFYFVYVHIALTQSKARTVALLKKLGDLEKLEKFTNKEIKHYHDIAYDMGQDRSYTYSEVVKAMLNAETCAAGYRDVDSFTDDLVRLLVLKKKPATILPTDNSSEEGDKDEKEEEK